MVEHLVLFKLKQDTTEDQKGQMIDTLARLKTIEGIEDFSVGLNHSNEGKDQGFEVGMRVFFKNQEALDAYVPSEAHVSIVNEIRYLIDEVIVVDYTV
jgi:hypothetical protein